MSTSLAPVHVTVTCTSCARTIDLECEGISGVAGYATFNEFHCPACRKVNYPRTPGHIISAKVIPPA